MSEVTNDHENAFPMTQAQLARAQAAEWLERRDNCDWCAADQENLEAWLGESWMNTSAYWRLEAAWSRADRLGALRRPKIDSAITAARPWPWTNLVRSAAAVAIIAASGLGVFKWLSAPHVSTYATPVGGRELLTLNDGSQVELNSNTVLRIAGTVRGREVWLDRGEAFFDVRHDAKRLFVVHAGTHLITDLGTKFTARQSGDRVEVALLEGRARIEAIGSPAHAKVLAPGDVAVATANAMSVTRESTEDLADRLSWQHGMLVFRHTTLADAAAAFNRYNTEKIVIADPKVAGLTINGTFPTNAIALFNRAAQEAFGLRVERRGNEMVISR